MIAGRLFGANHLFGANGAGLAAPVRGRGHGVRAGAHVQVRAVQLEGGRGGQGRERGGVRGRD